MDAEVTHRVQSGWKNWKRVSGVLCDRRMKVKFKGRLQDGDKTSTGVRGSDMGIEEGTGENKLKMAEMRMLRWMCGAGQDKK